MHYFFYTTSPAAWTGLLEAMTGATRSIYIEMYIFVDDGPITKEFTTLIAEKARGGVQVRLVLDAFGSYEISKKLMGSLREAGVEILFFRRFFSRLHRKVVIVDEKVGFIGGVNIHERARKWNDILVRVEGKIIRSLMRSFARVYHSCGGTDAYLIHYRKRAPFGRARIWLLEHLPALRKVGLRNAYKNAFLGAKKHITIVTPYFVPHRWLKELLSETLSRGIGIDILVPKETDLPWATKANYIYMRLFAEKGVRFHLLPHMNHSKLLIVDDSLALVGSQNIDALSFDHNAESGVFFDDPKMVAELQEIISKWKADSTPFDSNRPVTLYDRAFAFCVRCIDVLLSSM